MVSAVLYHNIQVEDRFLHRLAYQVAGIMQASGNIKKDFTQDKIVSAIYQPIIAANAADSSEAPKREIIDTQEHANTVIAEIEKRIYGN